MRLSNFQNRLTYLSLLPGIFAALSLAAFFGFERSNSLDDMLDNRALTIAKYFAPSCEYGVTTGSNGILQNLANGVLEERDMRAVTIYDVYMDELAHAGPKFANISQNNYQLQHEQLFLLHTDATVRARAPIFAQNLTISDELSEEFFNRPEQPAKIIGWVEVELTNSNTRLLRYQYIAAVALIVILVLLLCGIVVIRFSRNISLPLQQLLHTLKDLENGNLDSRVTLRDNEEFSELANGVNAMANALQRSQIEYQQNLEQATRDLYENMDEMEIRNSELIIGRQEAQEASRMKSEFLANVSHEIRTPLNGILGFSELLARTNLSDQQAKYLSTIHNSSEDLLKILNDILDLSKIDAGKLIIEHIGLNLRNILEDTIIMMAPEAYQKNLELNYLIYSDVPLRIISDPLRIKQVLINLISNAIKFTQQGSVNIRISTISQSQNHASIHFEIQDTGIGMNEQQIDKVFTAFSQADSTTTRRFGGTGLGLVISKALVEAMGGEMRVRSQPGIGSIFSFHIEAELQQGEDDEFPSLANHHAVLIDGTMMSRLNTSGVLSNWGLKHEDFETPQQLLSHVAMHAVNWQVILYAMDDQLPDDPVLQENIQELKTLGLPIIASTNLLNNEYIEAYQHIGVDYMLTHPCTRKNLYYLLRQALQLPPLEDEIKSLGWPSEHRKKPTVLAVDDNPANLQLVVTLLEELELPTLAAKNGQEAIDIIRQQHVDLVFMDIQMPEMNGLEATEHIRNLGVRNTVPIVALTAHAMVDEKEKLLKIGMNDYQTKPISQEKLISCIERWTGYRCQAIAKPATLNRTAAANLNDGIFDANMALKNANYNAELAADLFNMLINTLAVETPLIIQEWEDERFDDLLERVHKIHGGTRYSGVPRLMNALGALESALKTEGSSQHWPNLLRAVIEQSAALQHWAASYDWLSDLEL